jgi:A118 family predicted phage portal protein
MAGYLQDIINASKRHGFNPIVGDIDKKQAEWLSWYRGDVNNFHTFKKSINGHQREFERMTMNMPKKLCEDWVSLIWNEKCEIKIENANTAKIVKNVLYDNNFETQFANLLELAFGMGMGYMIEYLEEDVTKIDFINFQNGFPLQWDNGRLTALVTYTVNKKDDNYVSHLIYHTIKDGIYTAEHKAYISEKKGSLGEEAPLELVYDGEPKMEFEVPYPFFQIIKPNVNNQHDINSPLGVSIYSAMLSYFKNVDVLFDVYQNEGLNNKTRIVLSSEFAGTKMVVDEATGEARYVRYLDDQDTAIEVYPMENVGDKQKPVEFFQGKFQFDQLGLAIDKLVKLIGFRASLGKNFYAFSEEGVNYQNEKSVITSNNDTYRTKKKHEQVLGEAIKHMIYAILELESVAGRYNGDIEQEQIEIVFDDSIVTNDEQIKEDMFMLADKGMIPKYKVVAKVMNLSDDDAKELVDNALADITAEQKRYTESYTLENENDRQTE